LPDEGRGLLLIGMSRADVSALKMIARFWKKFVMVLSIPIILSEYFSSATGSDYSAGFFLKLKLAYRMPSCKQA